jgi:hypothetical protein
VTGVSAPCGVTVVPVGPVVVAVAGVSVAGTFTIVRRGTSDSGRCAAGGAISSFVAGSSQAAVTRLVAV